MNVGGALREVVAAGKLASALASKLRYRLVSAIYGVSKAGVRVQGWGQPALTSCLVGDDAAFATETTERDFHICGVADGQSSWQAEGIDTSCFSKALMNCCAKIAAGRQAALQKPAAILSRGFKEALWLYSRCYGSSTACILSVDCMSGRLHSANLGNSGFVVIRNGVVVEQSQELKHYFNHPYQLSNPPPNTSMLRASSSDRPSAAMTSSSGVQEGDLVVAGTDGLFSNLYHSDIIRTLQKVDVKEEVAVQQGCAKLVEAAHARSLDPGYLSPFAREGSQALSWSYSGGKADDITVLLAAVALSSS